MPPSTRELVSGHGRRPSPSGRLCPFGDGRYLYTNPKPKPVSVVAVSIPLRLGFLTWTKQSVSPPLGGDLFLAANRQSAPLDTAFLLLQLQNAACSSALRPGWPGNINKSAKLSPTAICRIWPSMAFGFERPYFEFGRFEKKSNRRILW
jgi:hypothetical protein